MYERYTERARQVIFFSQQEAVSAGSSYIEPEHVLLGIMRCCEPELNAILKLNALESTLRADLPKSADRAIYTENFPVPLSNRGKRVLGYAAEEADRLNSLGIGPAHLLLGILREPESSNCHFLLAHGIHLTAARDVISSLPPEPDGPTIESIHRHDAWKKRKKRMYLLAKAAQIALLVLLAVLVGNSQISGKYLFTIGVGWMLFVCAWLAVGKSGIWGFKFSNRHPIAATVIVYGLIWLYQILLYGWVIPLGIGIYRTFAWRP
jgi:hypothetical protein